MVITINIEAFIFLLSLMGLVVAAHFSFYITVVVKNPDWPNEERNCYLLTTGGMANCEKEKYNKLLCINNCKGFWQCVYSFYLINKKAQSHSLWDSNDYYYYFSVERANTKLQESIWHLKRWASGPSV